MEEAKVSSPDTPGPPGGEDYADEEKKVASPAKGPKSPPENYKRERRRSREKSRSRDRKSRRSRSASSSPEYRGRVDRGARRNNNRFNNNRRSPDRNFRGNRFQGRDRSRDRNFNNNRRSRSRSRDNHRRMNNRRNQSISPPPAPTNLMYQQPPAPVIYNDPSYPNYVGQNQGFMQPGFGYDYQQQGMYQPPPAPFISGNQMNLPIPPGDDFAPQQQQWGPPPAMIMNVPPPTIPEAQEINPDRETADPRVAAKAAVAPSPDISAAVAQELVNQRDALRKQRDEYHVRAASLRKEIKVLKQKKADLIGNNSNGPPSPKTGQFCKENDKLQAAISNKLTTIMNVIDMLNEIIRDDDEKNKKREKSPKKSSKKSRHKSKSPKSNNSSPERLKTEVLLSIKNKRKNREAAAEEKPRVNYTYYDPELHWCKTCNLFPKTAKDYLNHLHSKEHEEKQVMKTALDLPWREDFTVSADLAPTYPDAPTKRTPIRGLQFFVPSSAWFCKLCSIWMGDLHCASVHLKTETHAAKFNKHSAENPNFEMEWMTKRSHAYELYREKEGEAIERMASATASFDQIPLSLQSNPTLAAKPPVEAESKRKKDDKKIKKKKSKERKDRKKKKRTKKKKHGSSSSSTEDSDSDDSDDSSSSSEEEKKDDKVDTKNSIRVAMRNFLDMNKKKEEKAVEPSAKWTVMPSKMKQKLIPPPAPAFSENSIKEKKRDELIIQQWTPSEPIISSDERKLLEKLKGKLKTNQTRVEDKKEDSRISADRKRSITRDRSRSRSRDRYRSDRDRNYRRRNSRSRSSSRGYSRRSRSRSRSNNRYRSYRRTRSRSRGRRVEKAIVRFPPEPQLPPLREERKSKPYSSRKEEKKTDTSGSKKLPFIGRMPVFKKMESDSKKSESEMMEIAETEEQIVTQEAEDVEPVEGMQECFDDEMDLMPDPLQFNAMFGAPPPPPIHEDKNQEILPPGIDDAESEFIPKPISDAPVPRKGPLPKDFQDTLNLLFDGDTPKPIQLPEPKPEPVVIIEAPPPIDHDQPTFVNMSDEELSQHYGQQYSNQQYFNPADAPPLPADPNIPPPVQKEEKVQPAKVEPPKVVIEQKKLNGKEEVIKPNPNRYEMDASDLAMLGIDADDFL